MVRHIFLVFSMTISSLYSLNPSIFASRREIVREKLGANSIMIVLTSPEYPRNGDVDYEWRPDSDFWYLTGHSEPNAVLILINGNSKIESRWLNKEHIFTQVRNKHIEVWTGKRLGIEGAKINLGFESASPIDSLLKNLSEVLPQTDTLYINRQLPDEICQIPESIKNIIIEGNSQIAFAGDIIHPIRHIKSYEEIKLLQKAINITGDALKQAIRRVKPGLGENQIEATIEFMFREKGSERLGFPSIIGAGINATTLHYIRNDKTMIKGELLLIDVGAEYNMYTADITRTIPVNGKYSKVQRELYSYVLEAQKAAFDSLKVGMTIQDVNKVAKQYLNNVGYGQYFIHGIGHWIGLEVHDVGGRETPIKVGTVFTIEPGIYIAEDDTTAKKEYRGIGIRIEDDILMTEKGPIWLSGDIPKEIKDIEALMRKRPKRIM